MPSAGAQSHVDGPIHGSRGDAGRPVKERKPQPPQDLRHPRVVDPQGPESVSEGGNQSSRVRHRDGFFGVAVARAPRKWIARYRSRRSPAGSAAWRERNQGNERSINRGPKKRGADGPFFNRQREPRCLF